MWGNIFIILKHTQHLQIFDLQSVHVQQDDVTGSGEAVVRLNDMAELRLGEELLLCQRPAEMKSCSTLCRN